MTAKNLAAKRSNGRKSRGAVTPAGKARSAAAKLLHGFYSQRGDEALIALGEDPKELVGLLQSLMRDLEPRPGLQTELVLQMVRTLWRMRRADRMQDGLTVKRLQEGLQMEQLIAAPRMLQNHGTYKGLCAIGRMLNSSDSFPSAVEIEGLISAFGDTPPEDVQRLFPLLRSFGKAAAKAPGPAHENGGREPVPAAAEDAERESARQELDAALDEVMLRYCKVDEAFMKDYENFRSPENIAALMAPRNKNSLLMQRMEDSNLRQLWRLMKMFSMTKRAPRETDDYESST
jgi:hypothetical protein